MIGRCMQRHRHQEFIRFLNAVEREVPAGKLVHAILDNYATHKHPKVSAWLARHPRWTFHFTPDLRLTGSTPSRASSPSSPGGASGAASSRSVVDLQAAINRYIAEHNADTQALRLDRRSKSNPRRRQTREGKVRVDPLGRTQKKAQLGPRDNGHGRKALWSSD